MIVEPEPVQAMAVDLMLEELGCRCLGAAGSLAEVKQMCSRRRPTFALIDVELGPELVPVTAFLARQQVPFAILAIGPETQALDRIASLRDRPRVQRPFHGPTLHAAASALYQESLRAAIASAEHNIAEGRLRLARQLKLIERMAAAGQDTAAAAALAREYGRLLKTMRTTRGLLVQGLEQFSE